MNPVQYVLTGILFAGMLPILVTIFRRREAPTWVLMTAWAGALIGGAGSTWYVGFTGQPWALLPAAGVTAMLLMVLRFRQGQLALADTEDPEEIAALRHRHRYDFRIFAGCLTATFVFGVLALVMGYITR